MGLNRELRMLYRDVPPVPCRSGCTDCCGPVPWSPSEWARVADEPGAALAEVERWEDGTVVASVPGALRCPFAVGGACSVYDRRPLLCRMFGAVADVRLRCPHGCAARRPLSSDRGARLKHAYHRIIAAEAAEEDSP